MLHVIIKASGRLLRPEGVHEFRTAVAGITQVKPFTRVRRGKMERVKGYLRAKAELIKKLKDKAAKLRSLADKMDDHNKVKSYYRQSEKLEERARHLEEGGVDPKESLKRFRLWQRDLMNIMHTTKYKEGSEYAKRILDEAANDLGMSTKDFAELLDWFKTSAHLEKLPLKSDEWNHDRVREWAKDIARDLIAQVQGGEVSDEIMYEVAKANLLMNTSLRKYLITDRGLESRQAMAEWLTDEIASQVDKYKWDPKTRKVVSRRD